MESNIYLSDFFKGSKFGSINGDCVLCGRTTENGNKIDFSSKFTNWNLLQSGNCLCPNCYELSRNQTYRRKMWYVNREDIIFFKKEDILNVLLKPPKPPFAIYVTKTWKKQGFLKLINKVNLSSNRFFLGYDMKVILIVLKKFKEMVLIAKELRKKNITKTELRTGHFYASHFKNVELSLIMRIRQEFVKTPQWELIIDSIK
ncbi:MAG: hypothetical protein ACFFG0_07500 [Candidatus Thorarchaeota archaeon]